MNMRIKRTGILICFGLLGFQGIVFSEETTPKNMDTPFSKNLLFAENVTHAIAVSESQMAYKPKFRPGIFLLEIGVGAALGVVFSMPAGCLGAVIERNIFGNQGEWAGFAGGIIGLSMGYTFGSGLGVYLVGKNCGDNGKFWASIGSALGGGLGGILILMLDSDSYVLGAVAVLMAPFTAMVAYNLSREAVIGKEINTGLIHLQGKQPMMTFPQVKIEPHPFVPDKTINKVTLVSFNF